MAATKELKQKIDRHEALGKFKTKLKNMYFLQDQIRRYEQANAIARGAAITIREMFELTEEEVKTIEEEVVVEAKQDEKSGGKSEKESKAKKKPETKVKA